MCSSDLALPLYLDPNFLFPEKQDEKAITHRREAWLAQGGLETLESYGCQKDPSTWDVPKEHIKYLISLPVWWENPDIIVTHALATAENLDTLRHLSSKSNLQKNEQETLSRAVNNALWARNRPTKGADPIRLHISGHTPLRDVRLLENLRTLQIDTSCVYGYKLSAYCANGDFLSTPSKTKWEP